MNADTLLEALDAGHLMQYLDDQSEHQAAFPYRGSALGGCTRRLALAAAGEDSDMPGLRSIRAMDNGTDAGKRHARALSRALDTDIKTEHAAYVPLPVWGAQAQHVIDRWLAQFPEDRDGNGQPSMIQMSGRALHGCVGVLTHLDAAWRHEDGTVTNVEFKTKHPWGFKLLRKEGIGRDYLAQVLAGELALRTSGHDVRGSIIIFEEKGSHQLLALDPREDPLYSEDFLDGCLAEVAISLIAWADGKSDAVPPLPVSEQKLDWHCNYCPIGPVRGHCYDHLELVNKAQEGQVPNWRIR